MVDYLSTPPIDRPAVIVDGGGLVMQYLKQTEYYRRTGQELRLLNCRSACTMALSLPNACVYPHSVLKFHAAYDANTKRINRAWTQKLMSMYPIRVQERLGNLERSYKTIRGSELISLGVRRCR
jgi:hypothetical protein